MRSYDYIARKGIKNVSWGEFHEMCKNLAKKLSEIDSDLIVGIARGGLFPATLIAGMLRKEIYPIRITRRENDQVKFTNPRWIVDVHEGVAGKKVALVDEISDSGETLGEVSRRLNEKGTKRVTTAVLITHSWAVPEPDFHALMSDELVVFPWDRQILINGRWILHPELTEAIKSQKEGRSKI
ncbi:MAG: hypothetical protein JXB48_24735 [Candidatus Latescibacteria bacterium]|nr:hypothetical protein [Candidatus Latescibacterota bacterium]